MLYMIYSEDAPNSLEKRLALRQAHRARIEQLKNEERLVLAGPLPAIDSNEPGEVGFAGSLIVAEFACIDCAQTWANAEPYLEAGVYTKSTVKPFIRVF